MIIQEISKMYAKGLIQAANDGSVSHDVILGNLQTVLKTLNISSDLKAVLYSPSVTNKQKNLIIDDIFKPEICTQVLNLLKLLAEKGRFDELEQIVEAYKLELDKENNIKHIKVISAVELSDNYKNKIITKLSNKLQKNISAEWNIDKEIIGGLILHIDDNVIDTSIKNKLENLSKIKGNI